LVTHTHTHTKGYSVSGSRVNTTLRLYYKLWAEVSHISHPVPRITTCTLETKTACL